MIWSDTHARRWHSLTRKGSCRRRNVFLARASGFGPLPERRPHPPRLSPVWHASLDRQVVLREMCAGAGLEVGARRWLLGRALQKQMPKWFPHSRTRGARSAAAGYYGRLPDRSELRKAKHGNRIRAIQVGHRSVDPAAQAVDVETVGWVIAVGRDRVRATV